MKIKEHIVTVRDVYEGYYDHPVNGVKGYGRKLDIRPEFQREFVYSPEQQVAVVDTVIRNLPLNIMYWTTKDNVNYDMLDGQQRTISICRYVDNVFAYKGRYFHNLQSDEQEAILNYKLLVYVCEGTDSDRLAWFEVINIAGEKLLPQEIKNAVYSGSWVTDAKRYFSRPNNQASRIASDYLKGSSIRQDYLEAAIKWACYKEGVDISIYMGRKQKEESAVELWLYFKKVIDWVKAYFITYDKGMKGIDWGYYYHHYGERPFNPTEIQQRQMELLEDIDIQSRPGIFRYLIDGDERHLNIRAFDDRMRRTAYQRQQGVCPMCRETFQENEMEADHITPWSQGGKTVPENCQMLCRECNRRKSNI